MQTALAERMQQSLAGLVPDIEILHKAELVSEIQALKREKGAVVLGHNYMEPALYHFVADHRGDSLELARIGARVKENLIVFCGVEFMAETAKILSPEKKVLIPSKKAGCSLASSIRAKDVRALKSLYPDAPVVTYVNTYADVKAESDICVTSSNAADIVRKLNADTVIFIPDEYLAGNVAKETGKTLIVPTLDAKKLGRSGGVTRVMVAWPGKCEVHEKFSVADIDDTRAQFPDVKVLAHPECKPEVVAAADVSGSTAKMIRYVKDHPGERFVLLTECSMGDNIIAETNNKNVLRLCHVRCPHMAQITLEQTRDALKYDRYEIDINPEISARARLALEKMLAYS